MAFWNSVISFFWREGSTLVLIMALALAALLFQFSRDERRPVLNTLGFFLICVAGMFISGLLHAWKFTHAAEVLHETFVIGGGIALIRLWGLLVFRMLLPALRLSLPRIAEDLLVIIAYAGWGLVQLRYAGLDLSGIVATSAMITAVVAFAMQDTLGNILGGLALQLDNSIQIGDWIKVDDIAGRVVDIRWRSTLVETRNWETVVFPNSQLMKNKFLVLGRRTDQPVQWRRWVWFSVALDVAPSKVIRVVEETIRQTEIANVAKQPLPNCVLMDMDIKGYARYALRYWLTDLQIDDPTDAVVRWHIMTALQRAGIKLAMEAHSIHITKENEKHEEVLREREVNLRMKSLRRLDLLSPMTDKELRVLAERLRYAPFAHGNVISRQGAVAHWLYIIIHGEADIYLDANGGERHVIRTLGPGDFFGEMGMMTGAPRSASVAARTDVECYRLDKEAFEDILRARPAIAEEISSVLVTRRAELESVARQIDEKTGEKEMAQQRSEILATIRRFFGLGG